ncbi:MAG: alpha,alpha-phosphotrehalase [Synergistaceae bacterium]|nr:alpha,alpha-phosphotrehalase [Synergistaceae bacterium]
MRKLLCTVLLLGVMSSAGEAMTLREKVGQLFMIRPDQLNTTVSLDEIHNDKASAVGVRSVSKLMLQTLKEYPAGGFIVFRKNIESPSQLKVLTKALKDSCKVTPLMAVDEEGGRIARIANHKAFKLRKYESTASITNPREAASYIASYIKDYGFNINFAPVADVNTNPENIVIGDRAFGSDPEHVSRMVSGYLDGLHSQGIAGSIKHFPGHGDTKNDTHEGSVYVLKTWEELMKCELVPFIDNLKKTDSVMIAHIVMKNVTHDGLPATLSRELVTGKLRGELGYDGVVIVDALMMKAISNNYTSAEAAVLALEAGCDILLMPYDYREAFDGVMEAVKSGRITEARIDESVNRITKLKEKYAMNAQKWWQKTAVYQIYPKSFQDTDGTGTGDIRGIIQRLDYLQSLGVGAVWMTPVYPSPMVDNGYDIADYTGIDQRFGTMSDFEELIREADKRGIKIVMDLVFNHSSNQHKWFLESKSSRDNPKADWYIWRDKPTNWRSIFGGSAWTFSPERGQYYLHTFAEQQPDLNWENPDVRRALYGAANFWLDKGVGGFRIDAITYIKKPAEFLDGTPDAKDGTVNVHTMTANTPGILDFLREFKREVRDGHDIFTVGEANGVSAEELPQWVGREGVFDMLFEFSHVTLPFGDAEIWCYPVEWKLTDLKKALTASQKATANNGWYPVFFENHDQPRSVNHFFPEGADPVKAAKCLAAVLLTMRGTPFIYQGQELGMTNLNWKNIDEVDDIQTRGQYDLALKEGFSPDEAMKFVRYFTRDNARTPMQWTAGKNAGFTSGKAWLTVNPNYVDVNAASEEGDPASVLSWYKKLLALRKDSPALLSGTYREILGDSEELFAFVRELDGEEIITAANFSLESVKVPDELSGKKLILSSESGINPQELASLEARLYK